MSKSKSLLLRDLREIVRITHECRDRGDDNASWQWHLLERLARLVSADVAVAGELRGFRVGRPEATVPAGSTVDWGFENGFDRRGWDRALELLKTDPNYGLSMTGYIRRHATGTALTLSDLVPADERSASLEFDEVHRVIGINHGVVCFQPIAEPTRDEVYGSYLMREAGGRDFSPRETVVIREAFAAVAPLIGGSLARLTEPSPTDLPPRVRAVLRCLLEGDTAKQIARRLGISEHTVNQYTKVIFSHFRVTSRAALLARWLRRGWGTRLAWAEE